MKFLYRFSYIFIIFLSFSCNDPKVTPGDLTAIPYQPKNVTLQVPTAWGTPTIPADNPLTEEGIELGRRLFYDPILSRDSTISCASCHNLSGGFTDNKAVSDGIENRKGNRSSMALINLAFANKGFFWDGRAKTLEDQALKPIEDHTEMDENWTVVIKKLQSNKDYPTRFRKAFGIASKQEITKEYAVKAVAQFERSIISKDSKFTQYRDGKIELTDDEQFGYDMFFNVTPLLPDAQCGHCHSGGQLTTNQYLNNGLQEANTLDDFKDLGYGAVSKIKNDNGKMRVPTLHNISMTAPYMHNGSVKTLSDVIEHYRAGGKYSPNKDPLIQQVKLNTVQKNQILAFLKTFDDPVFLSNPAYLNPFY
jgi:cytochrome c peroxidase